MIGTLLDPEVDYPEGVEVVYTPAPLRDPSPALLDWLRREGLDPDVLAKDTFAIEQMPDGTHRVVFAELIRNEAGHLTVHRGCDLDGCGEGGHYHKTPMQKRAVTSPPPADL